MTTKKFIINNNISNQPLASWHIQLPSAFSYTTSCVKILKKSTMDNFGKTTAFYDRPRLLLFTCSAYW
ncbi:hypothetical protein D3C77_113400 [compost metagenome]